MQCCEQVESKDNPSPLQEVTHAEVNLLMNKSGNSRPTQETTRQIKSGLDSDNKNGSQSGKEIIYLTELRALDVLLGRGSGPNGE